MCVCSHPDPSADWRAVRVVGIVMVTYIHAWYLTLRLLMAYIYIYGAPILDVSRSHTTTHHSQ